MNTKEFEAYLASIGGLTNGFYPDQPPILTRDFFAIGDGWLQIVRDLIEELIAAGWNRELCQVKEKFGGLRFNTNEMPSACWPIVRKHEDVAYSTCETCGKPGTIRTDRSWMQVLCDEHAVKK